MLTPALKRKLIGIAAAIVVALLAQLNLTGTSSSADTHKVVSVSDGDTLKVLVDGKEQRVRLAEIDAPERDQPWGRKARNALSDKVMHKQVVVDTQYQDQYGRTVARILLDGRNINRELVSEGHAWAYRKHLKDQRLMEDERAARASRRGLWSLPESERMPPWEWRWRQRSNNH